MKPLKFKLNRETVEKMCVSAGMTAEVRQSAGDYEIFIADGFSAHPEITFKRFGVEKGEHTYGAYCTIWFVARDEDNFDVGAPMIFDAMHDPGLDLETKHRARINKARLEAQQFIETRKRVASERLHA